MIQLEELLAVRHSVFVVGGPGTGKSQVDYCITVLNHAKSHLCVCHKVRVFVQSVKTKEINQTSLGISTLITITFCKKTG